MLRYPAEIRKALEAGYYRASEEKMAERRGACGPSPYFIKDSRCSPSLSPHISSSRDLHQSEESCMCGQGVTVCPSRMKYILHSRLSFAFRTSPGRLFSCYQIEPRIESNPSQVLRGVGGYEERLYKKLAYSFRFAASFPRSCSGCEGII